MKGSKQAKHVLDHNYFSEVDKEVSREQVQNIFFENSLPQDPSVKTYSISLEGSVRFWLKKDLDSCNYDLYIGAEGGVDAPENCSELFAAYQNVQKIVFQNNFRTQDVKDMSWMFSGCWELQTLDISHFNTGNVTNMSGMFCCCWELQTLDVSHFNTGNVTDMSNMFRECYELQTLDISHFNIGNVTDMSAMFCGCEGMRTLHLGNFNRNGEIDLLSMFEECDQLETIFYSGTEDIEQIKKDFVADGNLRSDLADHVLKKVDPILDNFSYIDKSNGAKQEDGLPGEDEKETIVSSPKTRHVLDQYYFSEVSKEVSKNQVQAIFFENALPQDPSVKTYGISSDGSVRFWLKRDLKTYSYDLYIGAEGGVDAPENCSGLFDGCHYVQKIVFQNNFRTQDVRDMSRMFCDCWGLQNLDISNFNTANVKNMSQMFRGCKRMIKLHLGNFNTRNVEYISGMFENCDQLETIFYSGTEAIERIKEEFAASGNRRSNLSDHVLKKAAPEVAEDVALKQF